MASQPSFENLIRKVEQNLQAADQNAQNLSRKFTKTSNQLKDAEKRKAILSTYVQKTEQKIASLTVEHAKTKRKLNQLYTDFVQVVLQKKTHVLGDAPVVKDRIPTRVTSHNISGCVWRRLRQLNAITTTTDASLYFRYLRDIHEGPRFSGGRTIPSATPLCIYDLSGKCNNTSCPYRHVSTGKVGDEETNTKNNFIKREYIKFCKTQPRLDSNIVVSRTTLSKRGLEGSGVGPNQFKRYFHTDHKNTDNEIDLQDWKDEFVVKFGVFFEQHLTPFKETSTHKGKFHAIRLLSSNISIKTQELFARTVDVENRAVKSDDFSGAWFSPVDGDIDEKCNADVSFKEDILLHHCLRHITRVLQKCCCNCVEMGQSCCQYETSGLQGCFLDVVAALSHVDLFQRPSYKADEQLWVFYFALIKRMAWKDWPPLDIYLALISTAARDSKRIVMCLKELWDDNNRGSLNSFDQYVLTKYFRWREDYEETATSSAERPLLTVESSLSCDSYVVQLSLLLQIDKMVGRNLSPDIVKAVFGAVLGIPGGGEIRSDLELFNTYPLLSVLIDPTRCRYARDIVCSSREVRLVLWAAYLDYIVSGSCRATAMWQLSHMYSFVPEQEWNSAVIAVKSLTADDTEFRSELMTIIRLALAATDINLDQDSGNNALSFSVTANLTETLQNYDTSIHCGFESFIGFRETVWWHVMLLLESFDRDSSGMWSCIHELSSSNQYAFHMQSTFYPALYPKPHHQIGQDSLLHVLKIACALKSALKLELPPASFSCMIVGMMKDMNGSLLNMTMNSFWNINELLSMPYHPVEVLFFWLYTGIDKCLFRANNLPLFKESLLGINKIDRCNVAWLLQWVSIVALMISENPVEDPSLVIDLIDLVFLVFLRGDSQNELVDLLAIENSRVIEFMNIITVQYDRFGTALACVCRLIRQAQVILPRLDVLYSHFLKLVEVEHTKETANKSTCYYRPDYLGAFQLFTQQVSPRYRLVHSATAEVMEEVILGECNYSGHYNSCLYYYGREWCGYQNLRQFKSFLLLRVAISCFMTEKYLCTFVIQQELIYRRLRSPFDAACCFHLMAFTDYPGAINLASNDFDLISYPISEQFISIDDIREDILRDVVNVVSEPFVRSNLAADYFTSDQLKCNFEGKFSVDIPLALGFASQMLELNLSSCGLSAFPVHLFHLSNVMRLNVSHNNLMALPVDRFAKAYPKLVMCNLSFNNFTSLPSELSKIDNLQELYINDNAIEYIPDRLLDMNALRVFDLSNNKLKALPPGMIALRRQIQFLKLSGNPMIASSIPPRTSDLLGSTSRASATVQSGVKLAPAVSKISHTTMSTPVLSTGVKLDNSVSIPLKKSKPLHEITENNEPGAEERVHDSHKISTNTTKKETILSAKIGRSGHSRDMPFVLVSSDSESGVSDNGLIVEEDRDDSTTCSVGPFGACVHFSEESDTA